LVLAIVVVIGDLGLPYEDIIRTETAKAEIAGVKNKALEENVNQQISDLTKKHSRFITNHAERLQRTKRLLIHNQEYHKKLSSTIANVSVSPSSCTTPQVSLSSSPLSISSMSSATALTSTSSSSSKSVLSKPTGMMPISISSMSTSSVSKLIPLSSLSSSTSTSASTSLPLSSPSLCTQSPDHYHGNMIGLPVLPSIHGHPTVPIPITIRPPVTLRTPNKTSSEHSMLPTLATLPSLAIRSNRTLH
jgi:hypothetical protein